MPAYPEAALARDMKAQSTVRVGGRASGAATRWVARSGSVLGFRSVGVMAQLPASHREYMSQNAQFYAYHAAEVHQMMISCTAGASCGCGVQASPSSEQDTSSAVLLHATSRSLHIIVASIQTR
jgi:hypothetical protein